MATTLTPIEKKAAILRELSRYGGGNYSLINNYLAKVKSNKNFEIKLGNEMVAFSPVELWSILEPWCRGVLKLSIGDRGDAITLSIRALEAIDKKTKIETISASAKYELIKKQADNPIVPPSAPTDATGDVFKKSLALQREQIALIESTFLGKLRKNLTDSPIFKNTDPSTRAEMLQMVAYANHNFRTASPFTPDDLNQLLNIEAGKGQINKETHRLYSSASKADFTKMVSVINETINDVYSENEAKYEKDMATLRSITDLSPNISDVDWMVERAVIYGTPAEKARLSRAIRSELIASAKIGHVGGEQIISNALSKAGLASANLSYLAPLSPYLETIRIDESSKLQGSTLKEPKKKGLLATLNLTTALGVSADAPWQNFNDLKLAQDAITSKYGVNTLVEAYGKTNDLGELREIRNLMGAMSDHTRYREGLRSSVLYSIQDAWDKTWNRSADGVAKFSLLDPFAGITSRWTTFQTNIAINIHDWAINVDGSSWLSDFARNVGDFTEGFIKHEANWTSAGHFFLERKWGNVLDRAAKMAGYETMDAAKAAFWQGTIHAIEIGGNKLAAGLGSKIATSLAGLATSAEGIGLAILGAQIIWETLKFGFDKIKRFFTDSDFRDKILSWLPITLGAGVAFLASVPALVLAGLTGLGTSLLLFLAAVLASLVNLLLLALSWAFGLIAVSVLLFYIFKPTTGLDVNSGNQTLAPGVQCVQSGGGTTGGSPAASQAVCIANYLSQCHLNPLSSSLVNGSAWKCLVTALTTSAQAVAALAASAIHNTYLQCVGFVDAVALAAYNTSIAPKNACSYVNGAPPGFTYHGGTSGMQSGDFFVIGSSDCKDASPGHIGVVLGVGGAIVNVADANYGTGSGGSRANGQFATSQITGYLRKN